MRDLVDEVHAVRPAGVPHVGYAKLRDKFRLVCTVDRDPREPACAYRQRGLGGLHDRHPSRGRIVAGEGEQRDG